MITDYGCQCEKCLARTKQNLIEARGKWYNGQREIVFKPYHYQCGDGCCDEYGTKVYINGFELPCDERDTESTLRNIFEFLEIENVAINWNHEDED